MIRIVSILLLFATQWLSTAFSHPNHLARSHSPNSVNTAAEAPACRKGKPCCSFKLRIYQRCIPQPTDLQGRVETWPLFYDFLDAKKQPIYPIQGDYNMKKCDECVGPVADKRIGNITGPNGLYMRWDWFEEQRSQRDVFWDVMTYWTNNGDHHYYEDHRDRRVCDFQNGNWTEYEEDHRAWGDQCRFRGQAWFNRTRVCDCSL
jgi:hypothetical protein